MEIETRYKHYELTNHLGNVMVTVSDRKVVGGTEEIYDEIEPTISGAGISVHTPPYSATKLFQYWSA